MASGVRDDVSHEYTCFMRRGEDGTSAWTFSRKICFLQAFIQEKSPLKLLLGSESDNIILCQGD
jgi:hypothetical protein